MVNKIYSLFTRSATKISGHLALLFLQAKFEQFEEGSSNALPSYFEHHLPGNCGLVKLPCGVGSYRLLNDFNCHRSLRLWHSRFEHTEESLGKFVSTRAILSAVRKLLLFLFVIGSVVVNFISPNQINAATKALQARFLNMDTLFLSFVLLV